MDTSPPTDHENAPTRILVEAAADGNQDALESLLERHLPGLRAFVRLRAGRLIRAKESNSDLVQSACREVLQNLDRFQYQTEGRFRQWLFRTAERKIIDRARYYQAEKRDAAREVRLQAGSGSSDSRLLECYGTFFTPSRVAIVREELQRIEFAFDRLPEHYREVITFSRIVGLTHREISEELGKTEGAVRVLLYRALAELSEHLTREDGLD